MIKHVQTRPDQKKKVAEILEGAAEGKRVLLLQLLPLLSLKKKGNRREIVSNGGELLIGQRIHQKCHSNIIRLLF